jgi:AraC family transcriptional regulator
MLTFAMPLNRKPRLRSIGRSVHGRVPVERYRLQGLWCLHLYQYNARISIDGMGLDIQPGDLGIVPADTALEYRFKGRSEHLFAHFELSSHGPTSTVPALQPSGIEFSNLHRAFEEAVGMFPTQPLRAEIRLWDLLWRAVKADDSTDRKKIHPAVAETVRQIELRLHEPLLVEALAREVGLSHNHLTRLFHRDMARTVKGYMLERRMAKALHLLQMSSSPIKGIAFDIGFEDLHAFNKAIRRYFGYSPRALRRASLDRG